MRPVFLSIICVSILAPTVDAANAVRIADGELRYWNRRFEIWGMEHPNWPVLATHDSEMRGTFMMLSEHGVTTIGYSLHAQPDGRPFFKPDGEPADPESGKQFTRMTRQVRDHHLASVVSLFSGEEEQWLASAEAYRKAARNAAKLLSSKHSVIFITGDAFRDRPVSPDCPYPLDDVEQAIALCRLVKEANPEAMVGIPARIADAGRQFLPGNLLYIANDADTLEKAFVEPVDSKLEGAKRLEAVVAVPDARFLRHGEALEAGRSSIPDFLKWVEKQRLAVQAPIVVSAPNPPVKILSDEEKAEGFVPLFNGHDFRGWTTLDTDWAAWAVQSGKLMCSGGNGQWLRTRERYDSFILRFEYRISKNGNSGVFVWAPLAGRASRFGMEMQIRGTIREKPDDDTTGAIYDVQPPRVDASRPAGEWNEVEIACRGSKVKITINGQIVQDFDADEVPKLEGRLRRGVIGLQDHGNEVAFRRLRIKALDKPAGSN